MIQTPDTDVTAYRIARMQKAPRNWTYWIAFFSALNGIFISIGEDLLVLAGLVAPFSVPGAWPHYLAAVLLATIAYLGSQVPKILFIGLAIYIVDMLFAGYLELWSGVIMHVVVLVFVSLALNGARLLAKTKESLNSPTSPT